MTLKSDSVNGYVDSFAADNLPPKAQWPDLIVTRPEFDYPPRLNCVADLLDRWIENRDGERLCLISPTETLTYAALQARVNRICNVLVNRLGLKTGNRVLLRSGNSVMMAACYLAVLKAGGIVVATMPLLRAREIAYPLTKARIALALCDATLADEMERARPLAPDLERIVYWSDGGPESLEALAAEESPLFTAADTAADDICLIAFTSGTTGEPKGTMHFHRDMLIICDGFSRPRSSGPVRRTASSGRPRSASRSGSRCCCFRSASALRRSCPTGPGRTISRSRSLSSAPRSVSRLRPPTGPCWRGCPSTICPRCAAASRRARRSTVPPMIDGVTRRGFGSST